MRSVYQNCNIVTLPSLGEGLPTVLIEAAACGRSIVATDVAGCRDVVTDGVNGLLVPPNQPEALAQAIETLALDPELRRRMGAASRQIALETFTDRQVNQETYAMYGQLLPG
jgi:glycosyltransferase involved in cell wall biosynthesis